MVRYDKGAVGTARYDKMVLDTVRHGKSAIHRVQIPALDGMENSIFYREW